MSHTEQHITVTLTSSFTGSASCMWSNPLALFRSKKNNIKVVIFTNKETNNKINK